MLGGAGRVPRIGVAKPNVEPEVLVDADLDTLAAALHVRTDDLLNDSPQRIPWRPRGRDRTDDPRRRGGQTGSAVGPSIAVSTMLRYAL